MAENNHLRRLPLPAPRGVLLDRDGKVLVENRNIFNIALVREQTKNIDETLRALAAATGADEAQLRDTVARRRREPSYRPIVLIENASQEQVVAVWARHWELPGIIYQEVPSRRYRGRRPWPRTCSATSVRSPRRSCSATTSRASSPARSSARPASSRPTTVC